MNSDDRLFAIIGGTLVTATAGIFLWYGGGITGDVDHRPTVRVEPIPAASEAAPTDRLDSAESLPKPPAAVVSGGHDGPAPGINFAIRTLVSGLSAHPQLAAWLATDDLTTRFVTAVEAVADGYSPTEELGFLASSGPFIVREDEGRLVIAAGTFRRYRLAVDVFASVDAEEAVSIIRELEPEIEAARRGIAWHRGDFEDRLREAVDHLLEVDIPAGPIEVERRSVSYVFADDRYEKLSGAQRQLLRMGRTNSRMVQEKLRELRRAFGWPEPLPPAEIRFALDGDVAPVEPEAEVAAEVRREARPAAEPDEAVVAGMVDEPLPTPFEPDVGDRPGPGEATPEIFMPRGEPAAP